MKATFLKEFFLSIPDHNILWRHSGFSKTIGDRLDHCRPGAEKRRLAPVVDLMTALKQSLAEKERARPTLVPSKPAAAEKKEPQRAAKEATAKPRKQKAI